MFLHQLDNLANPLNVENILWLLAFSHTCFAINNIWNETISSLGQIGGLGKKFGNPMADFPNAPTSIFKVLQDETAIIEALWQTT